MLENLLGVAKCIDHDKQQHLNILFLKARILLWVYDYFYFKAKISVEEVQKQLSIC